MLTEGADVYDAMLGGIESMLQDLEAEMADVQTSLRLACVARSVTV